MARITDLLAINAFRRLRAAHALFAVQRPAQPDLHPLPVRDHEDVAGTGQGQGDMQRQARGGRAKKMFWLRTITTKPVMAIVE